MGAEKTSLEKGLMILELLNAHASLRVRDFHAALGLPKATVVRLLSTLEQFGLVRRLPERAGYCLTARVLSLSSGYHSIPQLLEIAAPPLAQFTRDHLWPTSLATLDFDAMVIRYSTIPSSPLSHKHSTLNVRLDLARRAHGRAYLAFVGEAERKMLMDFLPAEAQAYLERHLPRFRMQGWADRDPQLDPQTNSIAVPIVGDGGRVLATLGTTYFRKALTVEGQKKIADVLISTSRSISADTTGRSA